jgi:hypothetical protein
LDLKSRYVCTDRRGIGTARELLVESALTLLGFHVERTGFGVAENGYIDGWSQGRRDAFDFKATAVWESGKIIQFYIEVTGCQLTLQQSRRILHGLLKLDRPGVLVQKSKLEKAERLKPDLPVILAHVWDPTLRVEWTWLELVRRNSIAELRLKDEPTPYLVTPLDIWKPLTELRSRIQRRPAVGIADLMPRRR